MKRLILPLRQVIASLLIIFILIPSLQLSALASGTGRKLTLMVYMTGSDLESENGLASTDIREMLRAHDDPENVSVLVLIGGANDWRGRYPSDRSVIYELVDGEAVEVWTDDLMNMGDPATLTSFLDFGYTNYPADKYALILWNHGSGPLEGLCYDEVFTTSWGGSDSLDMMELQKALADSPCASRPLEWIGFDACLMAAVETAFICSPYAKYMIASQEVEPGTGWDYSFLDGIANDPSGAVTGIRIVDAYYESFAGGYDRLSVTLSCVDLRKIPAVELALDKVFSELYGTLNERSYSRLSNLRRDAQAIGRASTGSEYDLIDLYHLTQLYYDQSPEGSQELMDAIDAAVVYHRSNIPNINGLSIYYPYYNKDYFKYAWRDEYQRIGFSRGYTEYLTGYSDIWLSGSLSNWHGMNAFVTDAAESAGDTQLTMELTDDQVSNYAGAQLYVMTYDESLELYSFVYSTDDIELNGNTISAVYNNTSLYVLDAEGNPLSGALEYKIVEDTYMLRAVLCEGKDMFDGETLPVYIQLKPVDGTSRLEVVGVIDLSNENHLTSGKQSLTLDPEIWKSIYIAKYPVYLTKDDEDNILPFPEWDESTWIFADLFSNEEEWTVEFVEESYVTDDLVSMFVVTDTQGNHYGSELTHIENRNLSSLDIQPCILTDNEFITLELTGASLSSASYDPGLILHVRITNNSDRDMRVYANKFTAGDIAIDDSSAIADSLLPGETVETSIMLYSYIMQENLVTGIPSLSFNVQLYDTENIETIQHIPVNIDQQIDISPLLDGVEYPTVPESNTAPGELSIDMFAAGENEDGSVSCWLRYTNATDIEHDIYVDTAIINGCFVSGVINHSVWVPAENTAYRHITFSPEPPAYDMYYSSVPVLENPLSYWGIDVIDDIRIQLYDDDFNKYYVSVNMPEDIVLSANTHEVHSDHAVYSDDNIHIVRRGDAFIEDGYLNITLVTENNSSSDCSMWISNASIDSDDTTFRWSTDIDSNMYIYIMDTTLPAQTRTRYIVGLEADDMRIAEDGCTVRFDLMYSPGNSTEVICIPVTVELPGNIPVIEPAP